MFGFLKKLLREKEKDTETLLEIIDPPRLYAFSTTVRFLSDYYKNNESDYRDILMEMSRQGYPKYADYKNLISELLVDEYRLLRLGEVISEKLLFYPLENRNKIFDVVDGCYEAYRQNRKDVLRIFQLIYDTSSSVKDKMQIFYYGELEDIVRDNEKIISSLENFLEKFGGYISDGGDFTPGHFMDLSAINRLNRFSELLEKVSNENEATVQQVLAHVLETLKNDKILEEEHMKNKAELEKRIENVPKIIVEKNPKTTRKAHEEQLGSIVQTAMSAS